MLQASKDSSTIKIDLKGMLQAESAGFIYFVESRDKSLIRIGYSADGEDRLRSHFGYGYTLAAILRGRRDEETQLHKHFSNDRVVLGSDQSTYQATAIQPYVEKLLASFMAEKTLEEASLMSVSPYKFWSPDAMKEVSLGNVSGQLYLMPLDGGTVLDRDDWHTPTDVCEVIRSGLGGTIDLDPCSCAEANKRVKATYFFNSQRNGLLLPWSGRVYMNPIYSNAELWVNKLLEEVYFGNITAAISCLNLQSAVTKWYQLIWQKAAIHAIWNGRIAFEGPRGRAGKDAYSASQNGTIFSFFGTPEASEVFANAFKYHANVIKTVK